MLNRKQSIKLDVGASHELATATTTSLRPTATVDFEPFQPQNVLTSPIANAATVISFAGLGSGAVGGGGGGVVATGSGSNVASGSGGGGGGKRGAWFKKSSVRIFMRICAVASLMSVCANTSKTFDSYPALMSLTFCVDLITGAVFTCEMVCRMFTRGFVRGANAYARDRWCQFDATMVMFIWISVILQICEMTQLVANRSHLNVLRAPRPLILIRCIRMFFKFSMPKSRIKQIYKRFSQQIYNVTLFFLFFMSLYGLLGVQLFGKIEKHCVPDVRVCTKTRAPNIYDLAVPDTHCSASPYYGNNECPTFMRCEDLALPRESIGYNGYNHIGYSLYVVYQTSSQEGWSHLMYTTFDHYPAWKVSTYFVSLIFFLGWMVRNVFIAVFTETFNEIRVQFQQMWGERQSLTSESVPRVLRGDDRGWKLVEADDSKSASRYVPTIFKHFLNSAAFQVIVFMAILANVALSASITFKHDGRPRESFYSHVYPFEVGFTMFFLFEAAFKLACLGTSAYWQRASHRFELFLALACTINLIPSLFMTELTNFQVLRVVRLIKASPVLEDFAYKSFGPGRKLGSLVVFTFCLLVVTATFSMQLFCSLHDYHRFQDFPNAFMSMFQILTQEAWTDVMHETVLRVPNPLVAPFTAIYFIMWHLLVSLIVLSLFVAAILDNLELPEDVKKAKQLKAREQTACISEELPLRLRLFERFPDSPQMTKLNKSASEFPVPKVRESFMRNYIYDVDERALIGHCIQIRRMQEAAAAAAAAASLAAQVSTSLTITNKLHPSASLNYHPNNIHTNSQLTLIDSSGSVAATKLRPPALKLLCQPARIASSSSRILRKSTIHQLIHDSNVQRMTLMNDDAAFGVAKSLAAAAAAAAAATAPSSAATIVSSPAAAAAAAAASSSSQAQAAASGSTAATSATATGRLRADRLSSLTSRMTQPTSHHHQAATVAASYDYLRETSAEAGNSGCGSGGGTSGHPYDLTIKMLKRKRQQAELKRSQRERDLRENHPLFDTPLFIVGRESRLRKFCQLLAWSKYHYNSRDPITGKHRKSNYTKFHNLLGLVSYLDWIMILMTTLSSTSMMFETPTVRVVNTPALRISEYVFVAAMGVELSLKTLANGLVFTPRAVLSTFAGVMDMFIFVTSIIHALWMPQIIEQQSIAQCLICLRCIRPLRIFSLVPHMRQVVYELFRGFKEIFLVCVLLFILCFVFANYGVHAFGGRLARCTDPTIIDRKNCVGTFLRKVYVTKMRLQHDDKDAPLVLVPRVWANPRRFSFDDTLSAILTLFEVLSFKGWVDIREALIKRFENSLHTIYIHIYVFSGCMVGVTLFVGVVTANYGENKGTALLTVDQRRWCDLKKRLKIAQPLHLPPRPDHIYFRAKIYDITQHIAFKRLIAILVLVNSSLLVVHWHPESEDTLSFATLSAIFAGCFTIEVIMKMIAFTPRGYWQGRRNRYDLVVTFIGCVWVVLHFLLTNEFSTTFGFIVVILRFFTITGKHATLQMLMLTVVVSVYKSFFIILGLFVLVLFYSLLGVQLFGSVKYGENLSRQANFKSAKLGLITMFRIVTGEDWYRLMHDCMIRPPYCTRGKDALDTDCGNVPVSFVFFSSFYIIITHIVLNLLVAIIMENFSLFYSSEEDALLSYTDIRNFQNTWNMVDAQQRGTIPVRRVKFVLRLLRGRLEVDLNKDRLLFKHMCHEMERLHNGDDVSFHDVLSMLSYRSVDIRKSLQFEELLAREEVEYLIEEEVAKQTIRRWLDRCLRKVRQKRQGSSLIQGLRATNLGAAELFMAAPTPTPTPAPTPTLAPGSGPTSSGPTQTNPVSKSNLASSSRSLAATPATAAAVTLEHQNEQTSNQNTPADQIPQTTQAASLHLKSLFKLQTTSIGPSLSSSISDVGATSPRDSLDRQTLLPKLESTSDLQHSISSVTTISAIAQSIGKIKRKAEYKATFDQTGSGSISAETRAASSEGVITQPSATCDQNLDEVKKQAHQVNKAFKPTTFVSSTGAPVLASQTKIGGVVCRTSSQQQEHLATTSLNTDEATTSSLMTTGAGARQSTKPKQLNSAIDDIHEWWQDQVPQFESDGDDLELS